MIIRAICSFWRWCNYVCVLFFPYIYLSIATYQYFLEMMQVPRVESKLRVFSFKIHFSSQVLWYLQLFICNVFLVSLVCKRTLLLYVLILDFLCR